MHWGTGRKSIMSTDLKSTLHEYYLQQGIAEPHLSPKKRWGDPMQLLFGVDKTAAVMA